MSEPTNIPDNVVQLPLPGVVTEGDKLHQIITLATEFERILEQAVAKEAELKELDEKAKNISQTLLPDLLLSFGLSELKLRSGRTIAVVDDVFVSLTKAKRAEAFAYLREHGMGGVIKSELVVAESERQKLMDAAVPFQAEESVHPQTLKALVKEQLAVPNNTFPKELFGVFQSSRAIVKD